VRWVGTRKWAPARSQRYIANTAPSGCVESRADRPRLGPYLSQGSRTNGRVDPKVFDAPAPASKAEPAVALMEIGTDGRQHGFSAARCRICRCNRVISPVPIECPKTTHRESRRSTEHRDRPQRIVVGTPMPGLADRPKPRRSYLITRMAGGEQCGGLLFPRRRVNRPSMMSTTGDPEPCPRSRSRWLPSFPVRLDVAHGTGILPSFAK